MAVSPAAVLQEKTVNIKWYGKHEGILDIDPQALPDFYLVTEPLLSLTAELGAEHAGLSEPLLS